MVFNDLPAGAMFCFGKTKKQMYNHSTRVLDFYDEPMVWRKTALNGLSVGVKEVGYASFDHPRLATGTNNYMRAHGHRYYFDSSLNNYLNCFDGSWKTVSEGDQEPFSDSLDGNGFLSRFSPDEIKLIEPHKMSVEVPVGYNKIYGKTVEKDVLVGIPSAAQLGSRYSEGEFGILFDRIDSWVTDADTMNKRCVYGNIRRVGSEHNASIMPVIKIKGDSFVDRDDLGRYIICIPEEEFEGNIAAFLGFEEEAA